VAGSRSRYQTVPGRGEDRIALELKAKLGVEHAASTIRRYMMTRKEDGDPVSSTWRTFLTGHASFRFGAPIPGP